MKEDLNRELIDLRKFDNPVNPIELIQNIISNPNVENDPFYIVDLEDICNKHINWITKLPRVEPHYAVKCNTDSMLLKLLAFLGAGFDCASKKEIETVLDLGVSPHRIIFANPCKQASFIKYANRVGVNYMTFDNENELYKIKEHHPNAKCVLRIITNDQNAVCRFSMKFGADMDSSLRLIELAHSLNLDLCGVSFHVGSGQMSPEAFSESIQNARKLFDYAREQFGIRMNFLDLGGGYPGSSESVDLFDSIAKEINRTLDEYFPMDLFEKINAGIDDDFKLKIIAEPGRYYACSAFTLCVSVIAKRVMQQNDQQQEQDKLNVKNLLINNNQHASLSIQTPNQNNFVQQLNDIDASKSIMYYINDGVYASFNCLFYDHSECYPVILKDLYSQKMFKSSIWGPTCDGLDLVCKELYLPELETGEFMVFKNMGAYTISGAVAFNGIPLAKCIYVASTSWETIKEAFAETVDETLPFAFNTTCHASASLAFQRALSANQQPQAKLSEKDNSSDVASNCSEQSNDIENLNDELIGDDTVDCAIKC